MSLTAADITPGTYTARLPFGANSTKRFRDAVENIKRINDSDDCSATFDGATKTWTVVIADNADLPYSRHRLASSIDAYSAIVERA